MTKQPNWIDALPKATDKKCEAVLHSAFTLNEDGTETEYYNRERDGHKELSELLPEVDDLAILDNPFEGYDKDSIIWSQHQIILNLKKEVADLKLQMIGHLPSLNQNY